MKNFLSKLEKNLYDLKREVLVRNGEIKDVSTLVWLIDGMRNSVGEEMLKEFKTTPKTPWDEVFERTEEIWTYCNNCGWCGFVRKPDREKPCPNCQFYDLKQRYVIVRISCKDCGYIGYALQGVLKCNECESVNVNVIQKREVLRTLYGGEDLDKKMRTGL